MNTDERRSNDAMNFDSHRRLRIRVNPCPSVVPARSSSSLFRLPLSTLPSPLSPRAFTLVELLVTITIIGILAGMMLGALHSARQTSKEYATKATIAKLNNIIMQRYESYMTRRVPIAIPPGTQPPLAARMRLDAIRDLMRMEMPDAKADVVDGPITTFGWGGSVPEPALHKMYEKSVPVDVTTDSCPSAQCLYMIVSMGSPEAMEQFSQSEIGTVTNVVGGVPVTRPVFVDGWGHPIMWFRCAPGYSNWKGVTPKVPPGISEIQTGNPTTDHDPFDTRNIQPDAFRLIPLIYSAGADGNYGLDRGGAGYSWSAAKGDPFDGPSKAIDRGTPTNTANDNSTAAVGAHFDNITNHDIEQR